MFENLKQKAVLIIEENWLNLVLGAFVVVLAIYTLKGDISVVVRYLENQQQKSTSSTEAPPAQSIDKSGLFVDIDGAVLNPGVYEVNKGDRVGDLLVLAGGLHANVNLKYSSQKLNRAEELENGQKIYIPFQGEEVGEAVQNADKMGNNAKVSINKATTKELEELEGIGPSTSAKIIENRPYTDINELLDKKVIGQATFSKIQERIAL